MLNTIGNIHSHADRSIRWSLRVRVIILPQKSTTTRAHVERLRLCKPRLIPAKLGSGNHLHGLRDLGDVLRGVDAHHDLLLRRHPSRRSAVLGGPCKHKRKPM